MALVNVQLFLQGKTVVTLNQESIAHNSTSENTMSSNEIFYFVQDFCKKKHDIYIIIHKFNLMFFTILHLCIKTNCLSEKMNFKNIN